MTKRRWTPGELAFLKANWNKLSAAKIAEALDRSRPSVAFQAWHCRLGSQVRRYVSKDRVDTGGVKEPEGPVRDEHPRAAAPPAAMVRLAQFDPVIRRALAERLGAAHV